MPHAIRQGDIPGVQIRVTRDLDVGPEELWPWLVEPHLLQRWLATSVEPRGDEEPGWVFRGVDEAGAPLVEQTRDLVSEEARRWVAVFERRDDGWESATKLTVEILGAGPCQLSLLQQGFERLPLSRCLTVWELYRRRWRTAFDRLATAVIAGRPAS